MRKLNSGGHQKNCKEFYFMCKKQSAYLLAVFLGVFSNAALAVDRTGQNLDIMKKVFESWLPAFAGIGLVICVICFLANVGGPYLEKWVKGLLLAGVGSYMISLAIPGA